MNESSMSEEQEQQEHNVPESSPESVSAHNEATPQEEKTAHQEKVSLPGALLASRRQALGLTLEHIAEQLKMTPRRIAEIEADNVAVVQSKAVFRGFVRAYAKVLRMDPEPLVAMLPDDNVPSISLKPIRKRAPESFTETHVPFASKYNMQTKRMGVAIGLVVLLIGGLLLQRVLSGSAQKKTASAQSSQVSAASSATVAASSAMKAASISPAASAPASAKTTDKVKRIALPPVDVSRQVGATATKEEKKQANEEEARKSISPAPAAVANGKGALVLQCKEESWVELKRNNGELIASRYIPAGATVRFSVNEPMQLTIGNAPAVEATLRGRRLNLQVAGDNKVVRLNIK